MSALHWKRDIDRWRTATGVSGTYLIFQGGSTKWYYASYSGQDLGSYKLLRDAKEACERWESSR